MQSEVVKGFEGMGDTMEGGSAAVLQQMKDATPLYHRLVLIVGASGTGKTVLLRKVAASTKQPIVNVGLELARRMLDLTTRQRACQVARILDTVVRSVPSDPLLLDNTEILFDVRLQQDPLRLLQIMSRNRTVVATWSGTVKDGHLCYAAPGHPEYRRYAIGGFLLTDLERFQGA